MRCILQRVVDARVAVDGETIAKIDAGLLVFVCAMAGDTHDTARALATKTAKLRIFKDDGGKMNLGLAQTGLSALVVSQFTLAADTSRGNRPGFSGAAKPQEAEALYLQFASAMRDLGIDVQTGKFGADMAVSLTNDGPVTIWLDTQAS